MFFIDSLLYLLRLFIFTRIEVQLTAILNVDTAIIYVAFAEVCGNLKNTVSITYAVFHIYLVQSNYCDNDLYTRSF